MTDFGVYIHAPWCRVRCPYCAFNVYPDREADWAGWAQGVAQEWRLRAVPGRAHSLYFGGGTPSLAPAALIGRLIHTLPTQEHAEVTVEVNPGTLSPSALHHLTSLGVTRLSLGIQTFSARYARLLNRGHTVADARSLLDAVRALPLRSWSVDLIFALPGQTLAELEADLDALFAAEPPHVSLYGLTVEPGTPLERAVARGKITPAADDHWRALYDRIRERLRAQGYERYEVSNFARPGHRSVHNEAVWRGGHYVGLGPGAHGYLPSGERTENHGPVTAWLADLTGTTDLPSPRGRATDATLTALRHVDGIDLDALYAATGWGFAPSAVDGLVRAGLLQRRGRRLLLTEAGVPVADGVVRHLVTALRAGEHGQAAQPSRQSGPVA